MLYRQVVRFCCGLLLLLSTCPSHDIQLIALQVDPGANGAQSQPLAPPSLSDPGANGAQSQPLAPAPLSDPGANGAKSQPIAPSLGVPSTVPDPKVPGQASQVDPSPNGNQPQPIAPPSLGDPNTGTDPKLPGQASQPSGSGPSRSGPSANVMPPVAVSNAKKRISEEWREMPRWLSNLVDTDKQSALRLLLALSEYMIYGKHEEVDCDKLVQWLWLRSDMLPTPCADISGTIWKNFYAKFESKAFSGLFHEKSAFSEWKSQLPSDFFDGYSFTVKDIEDATVLEIADHLTSIINQDLLQGSGTFEQGKLLYMVSVWPTYLALLEDILGDNSTEEEWGMLGRMLPAWVKKHPKYSAAGAGVGGLVGVGGISALIWKYFKAPQVTSPSGSNSSHKPHPGVTIETEMIAKAQLFLAIAGGIGFIGICAYLYYRQVYLPKRDQRREEAKPTSKKSQRKSNKTSKSQKKTPSTKRSPSTKSRKGSAPETGPTST